MPANSTRTRATPLQRLQDAAPALPVDPSARTLCPGRTAYPDRQPLTVRTCQPVQNRIPVLLVHIPKLSIRGQARLAAEVGVSRSTVSRLVNGKINPSYRLARSVTDALERFLGRSLDIRDVFSTDGTYLTPSGCTLCLCGGCLPEAAWSEDGTLKPEWKEARPGDWSVARPADVPVPTDYNIHADSIAAAGKEGK